MKTVQVVIAGVELKAVKSKDGKYGVSVLEYQEYLGLSPKFTVDCKRGKSPEVLQEAGIHGGLNTFNSRSGRSTTAFIDTKDLVKLIGVFASRGNKTAMSWLIALANETLERRIDAATGETRTEASYEDTTKSFYRELARTSFIPKLASWNEGSNCPYGAFVNEFKRALRLPLVSVESYTQKQMMVWAEGITVYNTLRRRDLTHAASLRETAFQLADEASI